MQANIESQANQSIQTKITHPAELVCPNCKAEKHDTLYRAVYKPSTNFFASCPLNSDRVDLVRCNECFSTLDTKFQEKWDWKEYKFVKESRLAVPTAGEVKALAWRVNELLAHAEPMTK